MDGLDALTAAARDSDPRIRQSAAVRLGTLADVDGAQVTRIFLAETDDFVLETLTWAVVAHRPRTLPHLLSALADPDADHVRVLHALSKIEDPDTAAHIVPFAHDARPDVAAKAWWALARIGAESTLSAVTCHIGIEDLPQRHALTRAFVQFGHIALSTVTALFDASEPRVREHAVEIAVRILDPDTHGTRARAVAGQSAAMTEARRALVSTVAPEAHAVLTQLSYEFQHPPLAALAEELLDARQENHS